MEQTKLEDKMKNLYQTFIFFILLMPYIVYAGATGEVLGDTAKGAATGAAVGFGAQKAMQAAGAETLSKSVGKFMGSPPGIMILAGIGTANSTILYQAAAEQEEESEANIKKIDKIIASFKDSWIAYCPNGRESLSEPDCYCYLETGAANPDRTKSQICIDLWAKNAYKLSAVAGDYNGISKFVDPVGCVTLNGAFDESCKCKKFLDSKGGNACMKSVALNVNGNALGIGYLNASGFNNVTKALTAQASGASILGSISTGQLASAIARQGDINNGLLTKIANDPEKKDFKIFNNNEDLYKAQNSIMPKSAVAAASGAFGGSAIGSIASNRPEGNLNNLIKAAEKKVGFDMSGSGKGLANKKGETKEQFAFNLNGDSANGNGAGQLQDFPTAEKTYKIKSDISKDSGASIFEIISNRYIQSGLKRLFDE
jgi:hypothetical protein